MRVSLFCNKPKLNLSSNSFFKIQYNQQIVPSFGADSFVNNKEFEAIKKIAQTQKQEVAIVLKEYQMMDENITNSDIYARQCLQERIDRILNEYKKINEFLDKTNGKSRAQNAEIVANYFMARANMDKNQGFNRIQGYETLKNKLSESFCIDIMLMDRLEEDSNKKRIEVPNVVFFYGPTGTGKTTFAKALAEETQSRMVIPDLRNCSSPMEKLALIEDCAINSLNFYNQNDVVNRTRTIIILNEADSLIKAPKIGSPKYFEQKQVTDKFLELAKTCSEKYKCTIFITTNEPLRIDKRILDKQVTPIKVGLGPCDKRTAKNILDKRLSFYNVKIDTDDIVKRMFEFPNRRMSNSNIVAMVDNKIIHNNNPTKEDFLAVLNDEDYCPSIQARDMIAFEKAQKMLLEMTDKEWRDLI